MFFLFPVKIKIFVIILKHLFIILWRENKCLLLQMFCNLMNIDQPINNNQYNVVEEHKLIFLKTDPEYSEKSTRYKLNLHRLCVYIHMFILCKMYKQCIHFVPTSILHNQYSDILYDDFTLIEIIPGIFNTLIINLNIKLMFSKLFIVNKIFLNKASNCPRIVVQDHVDVVPVVSFVSISI